MKPWTIQDTRFWISQVENRLEDIEYYLRCTAIWCERNQILDSQNIFMLSFLTLVWVSHMRNEQISYQELMEFLGMPEMAKGIDQIYDLGPQFANLDHNQLLILATSKILE